MSSKKKKNEDLFGLKVLYLSTIGALIYLANCTRLGITFSVKLLVRYSFTPIIRHWNEIKHILRQLCGISDMSLYYLKE